MSTLLNTEPVDGTDARIVWHIPDELAREPLPVHACGAMDYGSVPPERLVKAGQVLGTVKPAVPGIAGQTLTAPPRTIPVSMPRNIPCTAGPGVKYDGGGVRLVSQANGIVEIQDDCVLVHPLEWIQGNLNNVTQEFAGGVVVQGDAIASTIRANGPITITGTVAGCVIRANGDVVITRCARSKVIGDGDVYILGKLLHSHVVARRRFVAADGSALLGGEVAATRDVRVADVGGPEGTRTLIAAAVDRFSTVRRQEVETEIARYEESIQKIASALRPLGGSSLESVPEQKRKLMQALAAQRRSLEERVRELHHEKRSLVLASKTRLDAEICITGTIYPGVTVHIEKASLAVDQRRSGIWLGLDSFRDAVLIRPIDDPVAA